MKILYPEKTILYKWKAMKLLVFGLTCKDLGSPHSHFATRKKMNELKIDNSS